MSMQDLLITPVSADAPDLQAALVAAHLPVDDLSEEGRQFFRFTDHNEPVGFGGLEHYGDCALLRSLAVSAEHRGQGFGQAITQKLLARARDDGAYAVYLLTETAAPFFEHLGFARIERTAAPAAILQTRQAASLCPASAALLVKRLSE
jgi:N-acetylglutamate synthase-like GNAT family acetyltransferase